MDERHTRYYDAEVHDRAQRPVEADRVARRRAFVGLLAERRARDVLEIGCGAGRDGVPLREAGLRYIGLDLAPNMVRHCRELGLTAVVGSATRLPFPDAAFDAAWSMSTLMHLPGDGLRTALAELRRVVRPGGIVEIGVWGNSVDREWSSSDGRYFNQRSDATLQAELRRLGRIAAFEATRPGSTADGRYQWARVERT